jgi:ribosome biogenesis GTPase
LITLPGGGFVIDSPGVREFGLHGIGKADLARHYPDFVPYLGQCGFGDCLHKGEPRCAVLEAVEEGELSVTRFESYLTLLEELE